MTAIAWMPPPVKVNGTAAELQAWVQDLLDHFLASGVTQTSDTGQLVPSSLTSALTGGTSATNYLLGYWVFRFNDALQSSNPIFFRVNVYSRGIIPWRHPGCGIIVGTGSNGSGTINGVTSAEVTMIGNAGNDSTRSSGNSGPGPTTSHICYNTARGFFGICFAPANYGGSSYSAWYSPCAFLISRTQDSSGAPTNAGFTFLARENTYNNTQSVGGDSYTNYGTETIKGYSFTASAVSAFQSDYLAYIETPTTEGSNTLAHRFYHRPPLLFAPIYNLLAVPHMILTKATEFSVTSGGTTPVNFVSPGSASTWKASASSVNWTASFLFE